MTRLLSILLLATLTGCFVELPEGVSSDGLVDQGSTDDAGTGPDTARPPDPDDGVPPPDGAVPPPSDAMPDARERPDADPNRCQALVIGVETARIRSWGERDVPAQVSVPVVGMTCPMASARSVDNWLATRVDAPNAQVVVTAQTAGLATGRHEGAIELRLAEQTWQVDVVVDVMRTPSGGGPRHVLVIGVDGLRGDAIAAADTPTLDWLVERAAYTPEASTQPDSTASAAGWTSIFTGVGVTQHMVRGEDFSVRNASYRSFMALAAPTLEGRGGETALAYNLAPLFNDLHEPADIDVSFAGQTSLRELAVALTQRPLHLSFAHVFQVDEAGQAGGFTLENAAYINAVAKMDDTVDALIGGILMRPDVAEESWLIVLTADNGGPEIDEDAASTIPLLVAGPTVVPQALVDVTHLDVHPTVMDFLRIAPGPGANGAVIGEHRRETRCADEADDDGDELIDCLDPECADDPACEIAAEVCGNGVDDDGDGMEDCDDPDCVGDLACLPDEICDNGRDDDGDGREDCADPDCAEECDVPLACEAIAIDGDLGLSVAYGTTRGAQNWLAASCIGNTGGERIWHFIAPSYGTYVFNTIGSSFDTVLSLLAPDCNGVELACNDDSAEGDGPSYTRRASLLRREMREGETVAVSIGGYRDADGRYELNIHRFVCDGPPIEYVLPEGEGPGEIQTYEFDNDDAPTLLGGVCAGAGRELFWRWTVERTGVWQVDTFGSEPDTVLNLWGADCADHVVCNDDAVLANNTTRPEAGVRSRFDAGQELVIVVSSRDADIGRVHLNVQFLEPR